MSRQRSVPEVPRVRAADWEVVEARTPLGVAVDTGGHPDGPASRADSVMTTSPSAATEQLRRIALAALVVAVAAAGVAVWALMRPPNRDGAVTVSSYEAAVDTQGAGDAKGRLCEAFGLVRDAVAVQTNADLGPGPVAKQAVAANARLATVGGGEYLLSRLDPAIPPGLGSAVHSFADNLQEVGMYQLAGVPNTDRRVAGLLKDLQSGGQEISGLCQ